MPDNDDLFTTPVVDGTIRVNAQDAQAWADATDTAVNAAAAHAARTDNPHGVTAAQVTGLQTALDAKSDVGHGHAISAITGLQAALDGGFRAGDLGADVAADALVAHGGAYWRLEGYRPVFTQTASPTTLAADGDVVGTVIDSGPGGFHAAAPNDTLRPTLDLDGIGGTRGLQFAGSDMLAANGLATDIGNISAGLVFTASLRRDTTNTTRAALSFGAAASGTGYWLGSFSNTDWILSWGAAGNTMFGTPDTDTHVITVRVPPVGGDGKLWIWLDGTLVVDQSSFSAQSAAIDQIGIGALYRNTIGSHWLGGIGSVTIASGDIDQDDALAQHTSVRAWVLGQRGLDTGTVAQEVADLRGTALTLDLAVNGAPPARPSRLDLAEALMGGERPVVFANGGQSNSVSRATDIANVSERFPTNCWAWDDDALVSIAGGVHLPQIGANSTSEISPAISFALAFRAAYPATPLIFVGRAIGGSSFHVGQWVQGNPVYTANVAAINALLARDPRMVFGGFYDFQIGETDAGSGASAVSGFAAAYADVIADLRADITGADAFTPFCLGELSPTFVGSDTDRVSVNADILALPDTVANTAIISAAGTSVSDGVHFTGASQILRGTRAFAAWQAARGYTYALPA